MALRCNIWGMYYFGNALTNMIGTRSCKQNLADLKSQEFIYVTSKLPRSLSPYRLEKYEKWREKTKNLAVSKQRRSSAASSSVFTTAQRPPYMLLPVLWCPIVHPKIFWFHRSVKLWLWGLTHRNYTDYNVRRSGGFQITFDHWGSLMCAKF